MKCVCVCGQHSRGLTDIVSFHIRWYRAMRDSFANGSFHSTVMLVPLSPPLGLSALVYMNYG